VDNSTIYFAKPQTLTNVTPGVEMAQCSAMQFYNCNGNLIDDSKFRSSKSKFESKNYFKRRLYLRQLYQVRCITQVAALFWSSGHLSSAHMINRVFTRSSKRPALARVF